MRPGLEARWALLQLRGQGSKALLFALCLSLGVAARVSVGSFMGSVEKALAKEARGLLTADLEVSGLQELDEARWADLRRLAPAGTRFQRRASFLSVVAEEKGKSSKLCQVMAVEQSYPFYGSLALKDAQGRELKQLPPAFGSGSAAFIAPPGFFQSLEIPLGAGVKLGKARLEGLATLEEEPGLGSGAFSLGPTLLVPYGQLKASGLAQFGSRISHEVLVALPDSSRAAALKDALRKAWGLQDSFSFRNQPPPAGTLRVRTYLDTQGEIRGFFDRLADFLRLASLLALLLGGVGAAAVLSGFVREQVPQFGVLRTGGASGGQLLRFTLFQCLFLGLLGSALGAALGSASQYALPSLLKDFLPVALEPGLDLGAQLGGSALGVFFAAGFSVLGVFPILSSSPSSLLRDDPDGRGGWALGLLWALFFAATLALGALEARSWMRGGGFVGALALAALIFSWLGLPLRRLASRLSFPWWPGARHGLRNLNRPGSRAGEALVALGCAALALGVLALYQHSLLKELDPGRKPGEAPGLFLIDIQKDQLADLKAYFHEQGLPAPALSAMVKARYRGLNGQEMNGDGRAWTREEERDQRMRSREQNLSWRRELSKGERITAGKWMDPDGEELEASLEEGFADRLGARIGDRLNFDVSGLLLEARLTSLRKVHWASFQPNFFILLSPWALEDAPQTWIGSASGLSDAQRKAAQAGLAMRFPNVTSIDVAEGSRKIMGLMGKISQAIRAVALFALASGLCVLFGIAMAAARARRQEAALLKTFGAGPWTLASSLAAEFGALGLLSALMGLGISVAFGWILMSQVIQIPFKVPFISLAQMGLGLGLAAALAGLIACLPALWVKPLEVLRED